MKDTFAMFHPIINFSYFFAVIFCSMFFMHPICLGISIISAMAYALRLNGKKTVRFFFVALLPMMLLGAILNPLFNHAGVTILAYLEDGNPLTLESILYGVAAAAMFASVMLWFSCYNAVMTSDKFIYLFGRIIPVLSLFLSMVLRFVPLYKAQIQVISSGQRAIGRDMHSGNVFRRIRNGMRILSILITWALENAIETADSMRARGYGLPGRSSFSIFRFDSRDRRVFLLLVTCLGIVLAGAWTRHCTMRYFPSLKSAPFNLMGLVAYSAYGVLCLLPLGLDLQEDRVWKRLKSGM